MKKLVDAARRSFENPATPLSDPENWLLELAGGMTASGVRVGTATALSYPAVFRAVFLLAGDTGKLPMFVYRRLAGGGKDRATRHPAYRLLRHKANEFQSAFDFRMMLTAQALLRGNGYAYVDRDPATFAPRELLPLDPTRVTPVRLGGVVWYIVTLPNGDERRVAAADMYHVKGLPWEGLEGMSVIAKAAESFGLGLAAREYGARLFANDASPRVVMEHPGKLGDKARDNLETGWAKMHTGVSKAHRMAILEEGMKLNPFSMNAEDAQLLTTRQFENREVSNWFGVPPHKLGDPARTSFKSLEEENRSYLSEGLDFWLVRHETEAWDKLLTPAEQKADSHLAEFLRAALVRADIKSRYAAYRIGVSSGWMSPDEVRERENENPIPGGGGKVWFRPLNLATVDENGVVSKGAGVAPPAGVADAGQDTASEIPEGEEPAAAEDRLRVDTAEAAGRQLLAETVRRLVRHIGTAAKRAARRPDSFDEWMDGSLEGKHREKIEAVLGPVLAVCRACPRVVSEAGELLTERIRGVLLAVAERSTPRRFPEAVAEAFGRLEVELPEQITTEVFDAVSQ